MGFWPWGGDPGKLLLRGLCVVVAHVGVQNRVVHLSNFGAWFSCSWRWAALPHEWVRHSRMRRCRCARGRTTRLSLGTLTTGISTLLPPLPCRNKSRSYSCSPTRARATSLWMATQATGKQTPPSRPPPPCKPKSLRASHRKNLTAWNNGDALVEAVAAMNNNTVVVVHSVGPLIVEPWVDHPNVTAVVWAGLGGSETGNALVDVLYGDVNPSGRLPYTIAKSPSDYPAQLATGGSGDEILDITYTEGCVRRQSGPLNHLIPVFS